MNRVSVNNLSKLDRGAPSQVWIFELKWENRQLTSVIIQYCITTCFVCGIPGLPKILQAESPPQRKPRIIINWIWLTLQSMTIGDIQMYNDSAVLSLKQDKIYMFLNRNRITLRSLKAYKKLSEAIFGFLKIITIFSSIRIEVSGWMTTFCLIWKKRIRNPNTYPLQICGSFVPYVHWYVFMFELICERTL